MHTRGSAGKSGLAAVAILQSLCVEDKATCLACLCYHNNGQALHAYGGVPNLIAALVIFQNSQKKKKP